MGICFRLEVVKPRMLEKICKSINTTDNENIMLLGDYNFRNINWEDNSTKRNIDQEFVDTTQDNFLAQIMDSPTRGDNILDLAFTNDPASISHCETLPTLGSSDHKIIFLQMNCMIPRITSEPRKIYLYSQGDYNGLNSGRGTIDWDSLLNS